MAKKASIDLEKSLENLEAIVEELESGDLPLEKAMQNENRDQVQELYEQLRRVYPQYELPAGLTEKLRPWLTD